MRRLSLVLACALVAGLGIALLVAGRHDSAATGGTGLSVVGAYVPQPASPDVAAAYFTVRNNGGTAARLTGVRTDASHEAMMHRSDAGGGMQMVDSVTVPAHGSVAFARGGLHVMITNPRRLRQGDSVRLTLTFSGAAPITVTAPVTSVDYAPPGSG